MNNLADLYRYGRGLAPDLPAAANWYLKAAKLGLASAMNSLGELSEAGTGVPQNYQTARNWYKQAADRGNADAMGNLGAMLESGRGGPQLLETATEWYVKEAALNGPVARLGRPRAREVQRRRGYSLELLPACTRSNQTSTTQHPQPRSAANACREISPSLLVRADEVIE